MKKAYVKLNVKVQSEQELCHFCTLALTSCKKLEKTNELSPRYLKTDRRTDERADKGDYYGPHRVKPGSKMGLEHSNDIPD